MKNRMMSCGIEESLIKSMMQERFVKYEQAIKEYKIKQSGLELSKDWSISITVNWIFNKNDE